MKKFLAIIALAGVFTACGGGTDTESTMDSSATMQSAPMTDTSSSSMMMNDTSSSMMSGDTSMHMGDSTHK